MFSKRYSLIPVKIVVTSYNMRYMWMKPQSIYLYSILCTASGFVSYLVRRVGDQFGYDVCLRSVRLVSLDEFDNFRASCKKGYERGFTGTALYGHKAQYSNSVCNSV